MYFKSKEEMVKYLRGQAFFLTRTANQIESGEEIDSTWAIDMELPKYEGGNENGNVSE